MATQSEIAGLLGISSVKVTGLVNDGILVREAKGVYDEGKCLHAYLDHLRRIAGRHESPGSKLSLSDERAKLAAAQRAEAELRVAIRSGSHVPVSEVRAQMAELVRILRANVLALPDRVCLRIPALAPEEREILEECVRDVLVSMSRAGGDGG